VKPNPMGTPEFGWIFEIGGGLAFLAFGAFHLRQTWKNPTLSVAALVFVACTTMAWQEFYGGLLLALQPPSSPYCPGARRRGRRRTSRWR
jgi:hypothetical protein